MISLYRCDDRIVHGQVVTSWMKVRACDGVIIIDDMLASDKELAQIYKSAVPAGKICVVFSQIQAKKKLPEAIMSNKQYFLITRNVLEMNKLFTNNLIEPCEIIQGPASERKDTTTYDKNLSLTKNEVAAGNELVENGFNLIIKFLSESKANSWSDVIGG